MNKPPKTPAKTTSARTPPGRTSTPPVSHLDDKITQAITASVRSARRYRGPLIALGAAAIAAILAFGFFAWSSSSREENLSERLYRLVDSPQAKESETPLLGEMDSLIRDARGSRSERTILKSISRYLAERAFSKNRESMSTFSLDSDLDLIGGQLSAPAEQKENPELLAKLEELGRLGEERFRGDEDIEAWARNLRARIAAEREFKERRLEKRSFAPALPPSSPAGTPAGPSPEGAPPPAPRVTEEPPAKDPPAKESGESKNGAGAAAAR